MDKSVYELVKEFKKRYPMSIGWRLKANSKIIEKHINPDEFVKYAFVAQKNNKIYDIFSTAVIAITNKRLLVGRKRVVFGYFFDSITPDLFNDLKVRGGIVFGKVYIDTIKEFIVLSNIDKTALDEIETQISTFMIKEKRKYGANKA